jgi:multiple sugar transport system substrate-binding protein
MHRSRFAHATLALVALVLLGCTAGSGAPAGSTASTANAGHSAAARNYPPPVSPDKRVTIRFENYNLAGAGLGRDATLKLIAEFEQQFPNIKVETKATGSQEIFPSVQAQLVAGNPPDIAQLLLREWDLNVEFLQPQVLTEIVPPDELRAHVQGEYPLHPRALKLTERNGRLQGLAYVFSTPTLFYNADLFRLAGLDPASPPKTWDDVKRAGEQIKQRTGSDGVYVGCIENDWCAQGLLYSAGARVMDEGRTRVTFGEAPAVEWFRFWQGMVRSGAHPNLSEADATAAFQAGRLGMLLQTSAVQSSLLSAAKGKFEVRATGQPSFGGRPVIPVNSGSALAILAKTPEKQRAAWELMKFLTTERAFTVITAEIGYLPLRTGIVNDDRYLKTWPNRELILPNLEQMDNLETTYSYPGQNHLQIRKLFLTAVQEVLFEGKDPEKTLKEAQVRAQDLMPRR